LETEISFHIHKIMLLEPIHIFTPYMETEISCRVHKTLLLEPIHTFTLYFRSILILSSYISLRLSSRLFIFPMCYMPHLRKHRHLMILQWG